MLGIKVRKDAAEKIKRYLARQKLMDNNYKLISSNEFIYFPISRPRVPNKGYLSNQKAEMVDLRFERNVVKSGYREALQKSLGKKYEEATRSYDIIGDIALINAENGAVAKKTAAVIMAMNKNVRTVLSKGPVKGEYRVRKYTYIAGEKKFDTIYNENGASFKVDVRKTFISTRLAFERNRITDRVKDRENVVVMFAGIGPFAIEIAKRHRKANVLAIELNKNAYKYMLENIKLNKTSNVQAKLGDVKKVATKYPRFADRIIMPLPKTAYDFLGSVLKMAKKRCIVHYYAFGKSDSAFDDNIALLKEFFSPKKKIKVLFKRVVKTYSANEVEIVIDFLLY